MADKGRKGEPAKDSDPDETASLLDQPALKYNSTGHPNSSSSSAPVLPPSKPSLRPPYIRQISGIAGGDPYSGSNPSSPRRLPSASPHRPASPASMTLQVPERGKLKPKAKSYWAYYVPALEWIPQYQAKYLPGDIAAGLTLASFQIPISMSYATSLAHVSTVSGLYGLVVPTFVYALMGTVPNMVVGPEAAISLVVGQAVSPYIHNEKITPDVVSGLMAGSGGAVLLIGGLLRFGFLDSVLSRALLRGFISAVGVVMVIEQLPNELGLVEKMHSEIGTHSSIPAKLGFLFKHAGEAHSLTTAFAFTAMFTIILFRLFKGKTMHKWRKIIFVPEILIVVIASTVITNIFDLDENGLDVVGQIKPGRVSVKFPLNAQNWDTFKSTFSAAFFCAILGFFESTIASKSLGAAANLSISTNRELVALGVANMMGSLVCALPSFGGYGRSKINALSGARTQFSGFVLCGVTVLSIAFLMPYFYYLPKCVLSAVISVVGLSLIEEAPKDIKFYWQIGGYQDLFTLFLTLISTIFLSVESGIAIGVGFSLIRVIHHATRPRIQILGRVPGTNIFENADRLQPEHLEEIEGCLIVKIPEPLTFANTGDLRNRLRRFEHYGTMRVHPSYPRIRQEEMTRHLIIDLHGMTQCDSSAVQILLEIVSSYVTDRHIPVLLTRMPQSKSIRKRFELAGITELVTKRKTTAPSIATITSISTIIADDVFFKSVDEALKFIDNDPEVIDARV